MKAYLFLAEGFEETEAIAPIDFLRRAGFDLKTVAIGNEKVVMGAHGIPLTADILFEDGEYEDADLLILPGGMPGTNNLNAHTALKELIVKHNEEGKWLAAICAAPLIFGQLGLLKGKNAVCYPGFEKELEGAFVGNECAVRDGNIITSRGPGCATDFALAIIENMMGDEKADEIAKGIIY